MQIELLGKTISLSFENECWRGRIQDSRLPTGNVEIEVHAFLTEDQLVPQYLRLLSQAAEVIANEQPLVSKRIYEFFQFHKNLSDQDGNIWEHDFTQIKNPTDCWGSMKEPVLFLELQGGELSRVAFLAECDWQLDGGIEINFQGSEITYCGSMR